MFKRIAAFSLVVITTLALMVMSLPSAVHAEDPTKTPAPTATPVVVDAGTGATKIVYWNGLTGGDGSVMQKMVEQFAKDNPDISIHVESYPWDVMFQKLTAS